MNPMMNRGGGMPPGMPPGGGMPSMPGPQPGGGGGLGGRPQSPVEKNLSVLNPADAQLQMASGQVTPDMTIRQFLAQQGVDVDGPISQLQGFLQKQQQNADPMNKMRNVAADSALQKGGPSMPPGNPGPVSPPPPGPQGQPGPGGLAGLMRRAGGR